MNRIPLWFLLIAALVLAGPAFAANYFVRSGAMAGGDGSSPEYAWKTLGQAIGVSRAAGDTIFVARSHVQTLTATITPPSSGTGANPIIVIADDGTHWPLETGTPTITCGANYLYLYSRNHWEIDGLHFTGFTAYGIYVRSSSGVVFKNCTFTEPLADGDYGVKAYFAHVEIDNCVFVGRATTVGTGIHLERASAYIANSTFDNLGRGIYPYDGNARVVSCSFGAATANAKDVETANPSPSIISIIGGHMNDNSGIDVLSNASYNIERTRVSRSYMDASKRPMMYVETTRHNAVSDYTVARSGGADYSLKVASTDAIICGPTAPAEIWSGAVYADSAQTRAYTVYAYRDANWDPAPTAAQLYLEVIYNGSDGLVAEQSTATLTNHSTWYALTVSDITPLHDGPVHLRMALSHTDTNGFIHLDPRLVATGVNYKETINWGMPDLVGLPDDPDDPTGFPQIIYIPEGWRWNTCAIR